MILTVSAQAIQWI